jgi:hypothetical protein
MEVEDLAVDLVLVWVTVAELVVLAGGGAEVICDHELPHDTDDLTSAPLSGKGHGEEEKASSVVRSI